MFVTVKLLNGCPGFFTYKVPEDYTKQIAIGSLIQVPFRNNIELALVKIIDYQIKTDISYKIKSIKTDDFFPNDNQYTNFITTLSDYYCLEKFELFRRVQTFLQNKKATSTLPSVAHISKNNNVTDINLTKAQQSIVDTIAVHLADPKYYPFLLHGVTGSGKTEVYKQLIIKNLKCGKTTILLLPEVSLAVQFTLLLKKQLAAYEHYIFGFHSAMSAKDKRLLWQYLQEQIPLLIIGVHLPVLLPIANLGLIIIDEEHESGFQEKRHPKINTKEAALLRAYLYKIPILLGSATPAISSLFHVEQNKWQFAQLTKRFSGTFPTIKLVNIAQKNKRNNFWISRELEEHIQQCLAKKEQVILFLNRRGYSFFIQCKSCGHIYTCPHCSVSLTVHEQNIVCCHYCDYKQVEPTSCCECYAPKKQLIKKGLGTQQLVSITQKLFPQARVARADLDSTVNKKNWRTTIQSFSDGNIDILIGTQTITKGYHFPQVTLVGIIWADLNLGLPIYTAAEVTLQQLIQVSGRAGRSSKKSLVIVQTMLDHPIYQYIEEEKYIAFYHNEIKKRRLVQYPPFTRFSEIELKNSHEHLVETEAYKLTEYLTNISLQHNTNIRVLGPTTPPIHKVKNVYSRKIYLKASSIHGILKLFKAIKRTHFKSTIFFTPNPLSI